MKTPEAWFNINSLIYPNINDNIYILIYYFGLDISENLDLPDMIWFNVVADLTDAMGDNPA